MTCIFLANAVYSTEHAVEHTVCLWCCHWFGRRLSEKGRGVEYSVVLCSLFKSLWPIVTVSLDYIWKLYIWLHLFIWLGLLVLVLTMVACVPLSWLAGRGILVHRSLCWSFNVCCWKKSLWDVLPEAEFPISLPIRNLSFMGNYLLFPFSAWFNEKTGLCVLLTDHVQATRMPRWHHPGATWQHDANRAPFTTAV